MIRRLSLLLLISLSAACVKAQTAVADSLDRDGCRPGIGDTAHCGRD